MVANLNKSDILTVDYCQTTSVPGYQVCLYFLHHNHWAMTLDNINQWYGLLKKCLESDLDCYIVTRDESVE